MEVPIPSPPLLQLDGAISPEAMAAANDPEHAAYYERRTTTQYVTEDELRELWPDETEKTTGHSMTTIATEL